jgi:hypothetical protein
MSHTNKRQKISHEYNEYSGENIINVNTYDLYISPDEDEIYKLKTIELMCTFGKYLCCVVNKDDCYDTREYGTNNYKFCVVDVIETNFLENEIYDMEYVNNKKLFGSVNTICILIFPNYTSNITILDIRRYHRYFNCLKN